MPDPERRTSIDETDAKGGRNEGVVRWVLLVSLTSAIIALTLIWVTGALTQNADESQMNVARKADAGGDAATSEDSSIEGIAADDGGNAAPEAAATP